MKTKVISIISVIFLAFTLASCQSKEESVISKFENLSKRVETEGQNLTVDDWELILQEYEALHDEAAECDFTKEQLEELGRVDGRLTAILVREGLKKAGSEISNFMDSGKIYMKGFLDGVEQEMSNDK